MGRMTNFTKEYLFYKAMLFAEEKGVQNITARGLARYCECSTYPIYAHFDSMTNLKERIKLEVSQSFEQYIKRQQVNELEELIHLVYQFFLINGQFYRLIQRSHLDISELMKASFVDYAQNELKIKEQYLIELLWLTSVGCCHSEGVHKDYMRAITLIWDRLSELDKELPCLLNTKH